MLRRNQQRGSTFIYVIGAVAIASVVAVGYLVTADNGRERSAREIEAASQETDLEERVLLIKQKVEQQALASAEVNLATDISPAVTSAGLPATFRLQAEDGSSGVVTLENFADDLLFQRAVSLSLPGDPFAGARAGVRSLNLTAQSNPADRPSSRLGSKHVNEKPEIALRQIPISEFTLYVAGGVSRLSSQNFASDIGRVYTRGDLQLVGALKSSYPLVSGGRVTVAKNAELDLQPLGSAGPAIKLTAGFDSEGPEFVAMARTELGSQVVTPQSIPVNASVSPAVYQAASTGAAEGDAQVNLPVFEANCAVHVTVTLQPLRPGEAGQGTTRYSVNITGLENGGLEPGSTRSVQRHPFEAASHDGVTVLAFDYAALGNQPAPRAVSIRIYNGAGLDPNAVVLVRGAGRLAGNLSIVSPHSLVISGDFNLQPVNGAVPAAALVTARGVRTENEAEAVWAQETFGSAF